MTFALVLLAGGIYVLGLCALGTALRVLRGDDEW